MNTIGKLLFSFLICCAISNKVNAQYVASDSSNSTENIIVTELESKDPNPTKGDKSESIKSTRIVIGGKLGVNIYRGDISSFNFFPTPKNFISSLGIKSNAFVGIQFSDKLGFTIETSIHENYRGKRNAKLLFINDTTNYRGLWKDVAIGTKGEYFHLTFNVHLDLYKTVFKGQNNKVRIWGDFGVGMLNFTSIHFLKEEVFLQTPYPHNKPIHFKFKNRVISQVGYQNRFQNNIRLDDEHLSMDWVSMPLIDDMEKLPFFERPTVLTIPIGLTLEYQTFLENLYYTFNYQVINTFTNSLDAYDIPEASGYDNIFSFAVGIKYEF